MMRLYPVFASYGLYQQNSMLTLRGEADAETVSAKIVRDGAVFSAGTATVTDGTFAVSVQTPAGSAAEYEITVCAGADTVTLDHILFGELWLATGQSNMEMANSTQPEVRAMIAQMHDRLRGYFIPKPDNAPSYLFPETPFADTPGQWGTMTDPALFQQMSAAGTAFIREIWAFLRENSEIPVGILNANWGATSLRAWLPASAFTGELAEKMHAFHRLPGDFPWNFPDPTAETDQAIYFARLKETACMYHFMIHSLRGVQVRGILWYQGESDIASQAEDGLYLDYLNVYYAYYRDHFAADPAKFPMITVLLYPYPYGEHGSLIRARVNEAFVRFAAEYPDQSRCVPISDLPPAWCCAQENNPIHPAHKYAIGCRMAAAAEAMVYGGAAKPAAVAERYETDGRVMRITFAYPGCAEKPALRIGRTAEEAPVGLYLRGTDGVFVPADCTVRGNVLELSHPFIEHPTGAAYDFASMEPDVNLYAGELPVAPFCSDADARIIHPTPMTDPARTTTWGWRDDQAPKAMLRRPTYRPLADSEVCADDAFTERLGSIHIGGEGECFGAYVRSYPYAELKLKQYRGLQFRLFVPSATEATLTAVYADGTQTELPVQIGPFAYGLAEYGVKPMAAQVGGWCTAQCAFDALTDAPVSRLEFRFTQPGAVYRFVSMEQLYWIVR